jgi:hypothetical protein
MDLSLLSQLDPRIWLSKIVWYIVVALLFLVTGFYSGCQYKQNQWDAEKFRQMEENTRKTKVDQTQGIKNTTEFTEGKRQAEQGKDFVKGQIQEHKPLVRIVGSPPVCPQPVKVETREGTVKDETTGVYLTAHFMQLYDVSSKPGDAELRSRTYKEAEGPSIDEGFEKIIVPNNEEYAAVRLQLNKLIDRIEEKQKLFQPESKGAF